MSGTKTKAKAKTKTKERAFGPVVKLRRTEDKDVADAMLDAGARLIREDDLGYHLEFDAAAVAACEVE